MAILKCDIGLIQLEECPRCNYLVSWVDMKHENEKPILCKWCAAQQERAADGFQPVPNTGLEVTETPSAKAVEIRRRQNEPLRSERRLS